MTFAAVSLALALAWSGSTLPRPASIPPSAEALGIVSGDFDGDGVNDLICGFSGAESDYLVLYPGNVDALFPHSPEARRRRAEGVLGADPFLPPRVIPADVSNPVALGALSPTEQAVVTLAMRLKDVRFVTGDLATVTNYATIGGGSLSGATALDISADAPAIGGGFYYLVKPEYCGSWQSSPGAEPARDTTLP